MPKASGNPKTPHRKRKKRSGVDIAFPVPKGLSISDCDRVDAKAYYNTADPYNEGENSAQHGGKIAALLGASGDGVRKTLEQIEADVKTRVR